MAIASGKLGKGGRDVGNSSETFRRDLAGNQSRPGELGQHPEASFASCAAMPAAKRKQRVLRLCYRAPKLAHRGSPRRWPLRGPRRTTVMAWWGGPAGVQEQGIDTARSPRNLRGPAVSTSTTVGWGLPNPKTPGPEPASGSWERRRQAHGVVSPSEGNEVRREGRQGVGVLHSTVEPGEPDLGEPWGGKEVPQRGTVEGKRAGGTEPR